MNVPGLSFLFSEGNVCVLLHMLIDVGGKYNWERHACAFMLVFWSESWGFR
jgi:hypothetical protein